MKQCEHTDYAHGVGPRDLPCNRPGKLTPEQALEHRELDLGALSVDRLRSMYAMALTVGDRAATQAIAREVKIRICRRGRGR